MGNALDFPGGPTTEISFKDRSWRFKPVPYRLPAIEVTCKVFAALAAFRVLLEFVQRQDVDFRFPTNPLVVVQFVILLIMGLSSIAGVVDRVLDKEIFAIVFVLLNGIAHWGLAIGALTLVPLYANHLIGSITILGAFCLLNICGELTKTLFLRNNPDFRIRGGRLFRFFAADMFLVLYVVLAILDTVYQESVTPTLTDL